MAKPYLTEHNVDDLGRMVLALLSEVWIMRDRMAITEDLLFQKTGITSAEIDDYLPTPELAAKLEALRNRFVTNVVGAPLAAEDRTVDAILARAGLSRPDTTTKR
jgi:hypothetical protein